MVENRSTACEYIFEIIINNSFLSGSMKNIKIEKCIFYSCAYCSFHCPRPLFDFSVTVRPRVKLKGFTYHYRSSSQHMESCIHIYSVLNVCSLGLHSINLTGVAMSPDHKVSWTVYIFNLKFLICGRCLFLLVRFVITELLKGVLG